MRRPGGNASPNVHRLAREAQREMRLVRETPLPDLDLQPAAVEFTRLVVAATFTLDDHAVAATP